ncbi:MAG: hypothetical protein KatS3mg051_1917 [Anaerolineae bacterium]|nr:MAG: hypothetical protein KatS3mg051_1720 [Anaerolineae bacterium]GIV82563.1 MAG: hypothetical protein KatS3mg051_1917 [Anaerolineae bacterium]
MADLRTAAQAVASGADAALIAEIEGKGDAAVAAATNANNAADAASAAATNANNAATTASNAAANVTTALGAAGAVSTFADLPSAASAGGQTWAVWDEGRFYSSDGSIWTAGLFFTVAPELEESNRLYHGVLDVRGVVSGDTSTDGSDDLVEALRGLVPTSHTVYHSGGLSRSGLGVGRVQVPGPVVNVQHGITVVNGHSCVLMGAGGPFASRLRKIGALTESLLTWGDGSTTPFQFTIRDLALGGGAGEGQAGPSDGVLAFRDVNIALLDNVAILNWGTGVGVGNVPPGPDELFQEMTFRRMQVQKVYSGGVPPGSLTNSREGTGVRLYITGNVEFEACAVEVCDIAYWLRGNGSRSVVTITGGHIERCQYAMDADGLTLSVQGLTSWAGDWLLGSGVVRSMIHLGGAGPAEISGGISDLGLGNVIVCVPTLYNANRGGSPWVSGEQVAAGVYRRYDGLSYVSLNAYDGVTFPNTTPPPSDTTNWARAMPPQRGAVRGGLLLDGSQWVSGLEMTLDPVFERPETFERGVSDPSTYEMGYPRPSGCWVTHANTGVVRSGRALRVVVATPWTLERSYRAGQRVTYSGSYWQATSDHTATAANAPGEAGAPWTDLGLSDADEIYGTGNEAYVDLDVPVRWSSDYLVQVGVWLTSQTLDSVRIRVYRYNGSTYDEVHDSGWPYEGGTGTQGWDLDSTSSEMIDLHTLRVWRRRIGVGDDSTTRRIRVRIYPRYAGTVLDLPVISVTRSLVRWPALTTVAGSEGVTGGTAGTNTITVTGADVTGTVSVGDYVRIGLGDAAAETHIVTAISGGANTTITTHRPLAQTWSASTLERIAPNGVHDSGVDVASATYPTDPMQVRGTGDGLYIDKSLYYDQAEPVETSSLVMGTFTEAATRARAILYYADVTSGSRTARMWAHRNTGDHNHDGIRLQQTRRAYGLVGSGGEVSTGIVGNISDLSVARASASSVTVHDLTVHPVYRWRRHERTVYLGTVSAATNRIALPVTGPTRIVGCEIVTDNSPATDAANTWQVRLQHAMGGFAYPLLETVLDDTTTLTAYTPQPLDVILNWLTFTPEDVGALAVDLTPTGAPGTLTGAVIRIIYQTPD